ncbi:MCP four helix bundle domain-containing protein, partial [Acinetobacter baumannii]
LGACFAALIAVMCLIAGVGVKNLWSVSDATSEIVNDRYVKVALGAQMSDKINTAARSLRNAILARNPEEAKKYLDRVETNTKDVGEMLVRME